MFGEEESLETFTLLIELNSSPISSFATFRYRIMGLPMYSLIKDRFIHGAIISLASLASPTLWSETNHISSKPSKI